MPSIPIDAWTLRRRQDTQEVKWVRGKEITQSGLLTLQLSSSRRLGRENEVLHSCLIRFIVRGSYAQ